MALVSQMSRRIRGRVPLTSVVLKGRGIDSRWTLNVDR